VHIRINSISIEIAANLHDIKEKERLTKERKWLEQGKNESDRKLQILTISGFPDPVFWEAAFYSVIFKIVLDLKVALTSILFHIPIN